MTKIVLEYMNLHFFPYKKTYQFILDTFDISYLIFSEHIIKTIKKRCNTDEKFDNALRAAVRCSREYLVLQAKLRNDGHYLHSTFDEVNKSVYQNSTMEEYYLDGLLLSQILWPNHYRMGQYFIEQRSCAPSNAMILDVPSGAGIYPYYIAQYFSYQHVNSVDISPFSSAYTQAILKYFEIDTKNFSFIVQDIFSLNTAVHFDFIVCGELIEHVEHPDALLELFHRILKPGGKFFLTTAIFAAAVDHIYLFRSVQEVRTILESNFSIESECILPVSLKAYSRGMYCEPINYACMLAPK